MIEMKSVFDSQMRQSLLDRIDRVTPASQARWGKMNAEKMLTHLVQSARMATGELSVAPKKMVLRYTPLRQLVVYWLPFPKGAPTAPELVISDPATLEQSRQDLRLLLSEIAARSSRPDWPEHPAFGPLGRQGWGVLMYRHFDHHLRQFGV